MNYICTMLYTCTYTNIYTTVDKAVIIDIDKIKWKDEQEQA